MYTLYMFSDWISWAAAFFIIYKLVSLSKRLSIIEDKIELNKRGVVAQSLNAEPLHPLEQVSNGKVSPLNDTPRSVVADKVYSDPASIFISWYKKDWMLKTGALLLLLGIGWFVTYAFMENWVGPVGRITLGFMLGLALLSYGWKKMYDTEFLNRAAVFFIVGSSVVILTAYVARSVYDMFSAVIVIGIIFVVSAFVSLAAVRFLPNLAYAGLLMGSVAPLLSSSSENNYILLFSYLAVVILGSHIIVHLTGKRGIIFAGLVIVSLYSLPYMNSSLNSPTCRYVNNPNDQHASYNSNYVCEPLVSSIDYGVLLIISYGFSVIFFLASIIGILRSSNMNQYATTKSDVLTGLFTAFYLIAWVFRAAPKEYQAMILIAWMMVFVVGAYLLFIRIKRREAFYTYAFVGIVLLGTATGIQLDGIVELIAYTLESTAIVLGALYLLKDEKVTKTMTGFFVIPAFYSLSFLFKTVGFLDKNTLAIFLLSTALLLIAYLLYKNEKENLEETRDYGLFKFYLISGSLYFWTLVWQNSNAFQNSNALVGFSNGNIIALIIFTIAGLSFYIAGKLNESKGTIIYGSTLAIFVVAHLLLFDIWRMDIVGKVITFIVVGVLLMGSAFIAKKK